LWRGARVFALRFSSRRSITRKRGRMLYGVAKVGGGLAVALGQLRFSVALGIRGVLLGLRGSFLKVGQLDSLLRGFVVLHAEFGGGVDGGNSLLGGRANPCALNPLAGLRLGNRLSRFQGLRKFV